VDFLSKTKPILYIFFYLPPHRAIFFPADRIFSTRYIFSIGSCKDSTSGNAPQTPGRRLLRKLLPGVCSNAISTSSAELRPRPFTKSSRCRISAEKWNDPMTDLTGMTKHDRDLIRIHHEVSRQSLLWTEYHSRGTQSRCNSSRTRMVGPQSRRRKGHLNHQRSRVQRCRAHWIPRVLHSRLSDGDMGSAIQSRLPGQVSKELSFSSI
jgi:hypothetical protein